MDGASTSANGPDAPPAQWLVPNRDAGYNSNSRVRPAEAQADGPTAIVAPPG